jgi:hypothetical protein
VASSLSDQLGDLADEIDGKLKENASTAGTPHRRRAAEKLAARIRRIAETAPEAPTDPASQEAVDQVLKMVRAIFPSWTLRGPGGESG